MKKQVHKIARYGYHFRIGSTVYGLGVGCYGSPNYSSYYVYPLTETALPEVSPVYVQQSAPIRWAYRLLQDKFSELTTATEIRIAVGAYWVLRT